MVFSISMPNATRGAKTKGRDLDAFKSKLAGTNVVTIRETDADTYSLKLATALDANFVIMPGTIPLVADARGAGLTHIVTMIRLPHDASDASGQPKQRVQATPPAGVAKPPQPVARAPVPEGMYR